jgi:hypothetical protein
VGKQLSGAHVSVFNLEGKERSKGTMRIKDKGKGVEYEDIK